VTYYALMRFKCLCFLALLIAACGTGESDSSELQTMTKLLIPGVVEDADWLFEVDSDATLQMSRCLSIYLIETLGLTTNDLRTYLEENSTMAKTDALETLIAEKESEIEASEDDIWATMGCFEDNARTTDFMRLMSSAMSDFAEGLETLSEDLKTEPVPTSVTPTQPPAPPTTQPLTTSTVPPLNMSRQHLYDKETYVAGCHEDREGGIESSYSLVSREGRVLWDERGFTETDYEDVVTSFCECSVERVVKEIPYLSYQAYSMPEEERQIARQCSNYAVDLKFGRKE
jgi:hypothetical protein